MRDSEQSAVERRRPGVGDRPGPARPSAAGPSAGFEAPAITLPRGGGAIRGIDEKLSVNPVVGSATHSVPLFVSPGRSGVAPSLALAYDSAAGNGPFGLGWQLSVPSIRRKTARGVPRYRDAEESDTFVLSGAEDLVPTLRPSDDGTWERDAFPITVDGAAFLVQRYRPRVEGLFARIERWEERESGAIHWRATTGDNVRSVYGRSPQARIADPHDPGRVFEWLLEETADDRGNAVVYEYKQEDEAGVDAGAPHEANRLRNGTGVANRYLKRVRYGNARPFERADFHFEVVLDYGEHDMARPEPDVETSAWRARSDPFSDYRAGFELRTRRLCRRVLMFHRFPELGPAPCLVRSTDLTFEETPVATYLTTVVQRGYIRDGPGDYRSKSFPPVEFTYSKPHIDDTVRFVDAASLEHLPQGLDDSSYHWVDLDGEGLSGVMSNTGDALYYKRNLGGGRFAGVQRVATRPSLADGASMQLFDLAGDGKLDVIVLSDRVSGYFARAEEGAWERFRPFTSLPRIDWSDPNLRLIDLTGDGHADVLLTEHAALVTYESLAREGFAPGGVVPKPFDEAAGPALVFADGTQSVYLADMSGDGLADIVRVRNGEVCYWPNLGHGRFGARVTMRTPPLFDHPALFEQARLRLADIDGTGPTDIVYLGRDAATIWFNQAGNGWSAPRRIGSFPPVDSVSSVSVVDLLGTGTACLVWSSPLAADRGAPLRYIDLLGAGKPHLLVSVRNNLGAETRLAYAPSTRFYLEDRAAGTPWVTRLPFPVHVVERVEVYDAVSRTLVVSSYRYRHGHFDGREREFRGFGYVERRDAESFDASAGKGLFPDVAVANGDGELRLPPVVTKRWFHTGAWLGRGRIGRRYAEEYYDESRHHSLGIAPQLPDTVLPEGIAGGPGAPRELTPEEEREACRALKGLPLRTEVYAEDGSDRATHPYRVTETSFTVRWLQPGRPNEHAVFFAHPREALDFDYERDPVDPRVRHVLTLAVDGWGNVTRSAALAYPRRGSGHLPEQSRPLVVVAETDFFNSPDRYPAERAWYRTGVPVETRRWELTGVDADGARPLSVTDLRAHVAAAAELPYDAESSPAAVEKRLVERGRTLFATNDQSGPLPIGEVQSLALPWQSFQLAFTEGLLAAAYGGRVTDAMLGAEGGYVREHTTRGAAGPSQDGTWWIPSGRQRFDAGRFHLPAAAIDPFGAEYTIAHDPHDLVMARVVDPLGNASSARYEYRVLAPDLLTEPNGNSQGVAFDELGTVTATVVMGRNGEGDSWADPTTRLEYDLHRIPVSVRTLTRERHADTWTPWQESHTYFDGSGREVMVKVRAEPDDDGDPRWVGKGRTVFDNKANAVKQYEPYFSSTPEFEDEDAIVQHGVTPTLRYDPLGRLVRTDLPNGTYTRLDFGPWESRSFDANDTVADSAWLAARKGPGATITTPEEVRAADLALAHRDTPAVTRFDVLGRPVRWVEDNGAAGRYETRAVLDVEGRQRAVVDARGNGALEQVFDVAGRVLHTRSADAGRRWILPDVAGKLIRTWDDRGHARRQLHDALRRPTELYVASGGEPERLTHLVVYGEGHPESAARNLRGRAFRHYDGAGVETAETFDFKGNLVEASRRLAVVYEQTPDWSALTGVALADLDPLAESLGLLGPERFATSTSRDALNRPVTITFPDATVIEPTYNEASLLDQVRARLRGSPESTAFVTDVEYNAKGQRERITYANGTGTRFEYDPLTFRVVRLLTLRPADGATLRDLRYTYDPVGNIAEIRDLAQPTVVFANQVVEPHAAYVYDALYRLVEATGREHASQGGTGQPDHGDIPRSPLPHPNDARALRRYREHYAYDAVGNILEMGHRLEGPSGGPWPPADWRRRYRYAPDSNRLHAHSLSGDLPDGPFGATFDHDAHGNMTRMPHLARVDWTADDRMRYADLGGGGHAFYAYSASGERVRKVWHHGGLVEERIYLGGFEIYRRRLGGSVELERETVHVSDGSQRVALVETTTVDQGGALSNPAVRSRYQLDDHLGSALLEVDEIGAVISYEQYHPYGTTAYHSARATVAVGAKRFRYTGKERDEETALYYHGARYYACWLARWTAADPAGMVDGPNRYAYARGSPVVLRDADGMQSVFPFLNDADDLERKEVTGGEYGAEKADPNETYGPGEERPTDDSMPEVPPPSPPRTPRPPPLPPKGPRRESKGPPEPDERIAADDAADAADPPVAAGAPSESMTAPRAERPPNEVDKRPRPTVNRVRATWVMIGDYDEKGREAARRAAEQGLTGRDANELYLAWNFAREDYRKVNLSNGDPVLRNAEHYLFRRWLASEGGIVWIPDGLPFMDPGTFNPTIPMEAKFMEYFHDTIYNRFRRTIGEWLFDITPSTPDMYFFESLGYTEGERLKRKREDPSTSWDAYAQ
jgi:RHS repeat-associated protein